MAPWFLELVGLPNHGRAFELCFWALTLLLGALLIGRELRSARRVGDNVLAWLIGVGLGFFGAFRLVAAARGELYFGDSGLRIPTYGVAMALGFAVPLALGMRDARRHPAALTPDDALDLTFWVIVSGLVGARLLAFATDLPNTIGACIAPAEGETGACRELLMFWRGGLVFYGGVIGALAGGAWWCRRRSIPFLAAADQFVPFMALGHAIGRLGCVAAGCCFGAACPTRSAASALALRYPQGSAAWNAHLQVHGGVTEQMAATLRSMPVHPVQMYEVGVELLLFAVLLGFAHREARRVPSGRVVGAWMVAYGGARLVLEVFRGDAIRGFVFEWHSVGVARTLGIAPETPLLMSTSQVIALGLVAVGVALLVRGGGTGRRNADDVDRDPGAG